MITVERLRALLAMARDAHAHDVERDCRAELVALHEGRADEEHHVSMLRAARVAEDEARARYRATRTLRRGVLCALLAGLEEDAASVESGAVSRWWTPPIPRDGAA